ncbi:HAD-superfamily hydrolase, subfamily IA, variant 3 [Cyanobacterium stanieri PCC 7202]|uniref:HAD-superfamily hydrolase, subfamily IA, variant 3 n=1 Tax=Cyanobacterium stanieri (strain ATCC 29140 / PCC 7202) TaxID=292563 RepID=K9YJP7_CYASC|nr:HAD-superfamily hydrolase, subfamily IA, variant 3 [Cyanobacterium stanieri PCC 7202]
MNLKALIFDVDGTIAETERDGHRVAFNLAFDELNLPWQWDVDFYGKLLKIGGGKERFTYYLNNYQQDFKLPSSLDDFVLNVHKIKNQYYAQLVQDKTIKLRTGVARLMTEAHQNNVRLAIASTSAVKNVKALLDGTCDPEMISWIEVIAAGDMVENKKPAPDIYLLALEKLNLSPAECVTIEDTNQGLVAATKADVKTIVTVNEYTKDENFDSAMVVLNHLGEKEKPCQIIQHQENVSDFMDKLENEYLTIDLINQFLTIN